MQTCPYCGSVHPQKANFCTKTGQPLLEIETLAPVQSDLPSASSQDLTSPTENDKNAIPVKVKRAWNPLYLLLGIGGFLSVAGLAIIIYSLANDVFTVVPKVTPTILPTLSPPAVSLISTQDVSEFVDLTPTSQENQITSTPIIAATSTTTITPTETRSSFVTRINEKDQAILVFIPSGKFTMGSDPDVDPYFWGAESPRHEVTLGEYWIYQTEVTNSMYQQCTSAQACPLPTQKKSRSATSYYDNPDFASYPVIFVGWVSAQAYCEWAGGRLPTEAQWEKAARGDQDERLFPWGNNSATGNQANFCDIGCAQTQADRNKNDGYPNTAPVGSYPEGISPYGVHDMAGNVWEWVFDYFQPTYSSAAVDDPIGPASSKYRVIRGGSWSNPSAGVRIVQRDGVRPDISLDTLGFRCVVEVKP